MKKLLFLVVITIFGMSAMNAQDQFKLGIAVGLPIGDAGDVSLFAIAVDLGYMFEISENFKAGPITGYSHTFGDDDSSSPIAILGDGNPDVSFIPIGAGGRFVVAPKLLLGADLGYAIGLNDGNDGGFYYSPRISYSASEDVDIVAAFRGVAVDGGSWDIISVGVEFGFGGK
jgi:hypothetical protein